MRNPFRYGEIVSGEAFTGRQRELAELLADMQQGQNVVVMAPRRYGKTSLVKEAIVRARADGVLVAYVDLFRAPTKERFAGQLATAIHSGLLAPTERLRNRIADFVRSLPVRPKMTFGDDGSPQFEFTSGEDTRDTDDLIEALLDVPAKVANRRERPVVLVMDEFQQIVDLDPNLPALMRSIFQEQSDVAHVFLGSKEHLMRRVFTDRNEPMYRIARHLLLPPIASDEFASFIVGQFVRTDMTIASEAVAAVLRGTGGHPNDTQQWCHFLWALARERETADVDASMANAALDRVLDAESARFDDLWDQLNKEQRAVLTALASTEEAGIFSEAFRREHHLGSAASVQGALRRLTQRQLVDRIPRGRYTIPDVFFRAWIGRRVVSPGPE